MNVGVEDLGVDEDWLVVDAYLVKKQNYLQNLYNIVGPHDPLPSFWAPEM